jgi:hypothetical protein
MQIYQIHCFRHIHEWTDLTIEARDEDEAAAIAKEHFLTMGPSDCQSEAPEESEFNNEHTGDFLYPEKPRPRRHD